MDVKDKLRRQKFGGALRKTIVVIFLTIMSIIVLIPFYWMIASSFKTNQELDSNPPTLYPHKFTFANYERAFYGRKYTRLKEFNNTLYNIEKSIKDFENQHKDYKFDDKTYAQNQQNLKNLEDQYKDKPTELYTQQYLNVANKLDQLDKKYDQLDQQYKDLDKQKRDYLRDKRQTESKLKKADPNSDEYKNLQQHLKEVETNITNITNQLKQIKVEKGNIQNSYSSIQSNINNLKNQVQDLQNQLKDTTSESKKNELNSQISSLNNQIAEQQKLLEKTPKDRSTLNSELTEIEKNPDDYFVNAEAKKIYSYILAYQQYQQYKFNETKAKDSIKTEQTSEETPFVKYLGYTVLVGVASTIIGTFLSIIGAFALSRLNFRGRDTIFGVMLATMMIPGEMMVITNYVTITKFKWFYQNELFQGATFLAMIVPFVVTVFHIYLLRQNFKQIPNELYYASKVDGTSDWKYLWKVMVPLAKSSIITIVILKLMGTWNAYIWPQLVGGDKYQLITVWLRETFVDDQRVNVGAQMAGTVLVLLPLLLVFIFMRKYIMRGVSRGGTKG